MSRNEHFDAGAQQHPVFEVGDPEEYTNPRYKVTSYGAKDKVHPSAFGMQVRQYKPGPTESLGHDQPVTHVPISKVWGTQDYVYAPHVRNLATVPGHIMEPVRGTAYPDGTFESEDHHRVAAAHLRGDKTVPMQIVYRRRA